MVIWLARFGAKLALRATLGEMLSDLDWHDLVEGSSRVPALAPPPLANAVNEAGAAITLPPFATRMLHELRGDKP